MAIDIRPYAPGDLDAVMRVWRAATAIAHPFQTDADLDRDEALIRGEYMHRTESWCGWRDGALLGFVSLMGSRIVALFVAPDCQRGGVGSALLAHVNERRGPLGVEVFRDNAIAVPFYRRHGFVHVRDEPTELYPDQVLWLMAQPGAPEA